MVNIEELIKKICESGFTEEQMAEMLDMEKELFDDKLRNCGSCFTIKEVKELVKILGLEGMEATKIFFARLSHKCD